MTLSFSGPGDAQAMSLDAGSCLAGNLSCRKSNSATPIKTAKSAGNKLQAAGKVDDDNDDDVDEEPTLLRTQVAWDARRTLRLLSLQPNLFSFVIVCT